MRLLLGILLPVTLMGSAIYFIWKGIVQSFSKVEFAYVRFRDGVLVLNRTTRFGEEEVSFSPSQEFSDLEPLQLAAHSGGASWFTFPEGFEVKIKSREARAIQRCLRFAQNTGLLEAELTTD